jgi:AraC-like DNA-binding protein
VDADGRSGINGTRLLMRFAHRTLTRPPLSSYADLLWLAEGYAQPHSCERLLPTGNMDMVLSLDGERGRDTVSGAQSHFTILDTSRPLSLIGVRFRAGGGFPFFGVPAGELHNLCVPLDALWGTAAAQLREQLHEARTAAARFDILEQVLLQRLRAGRLRSPVVRYAIGRFKDPTQDTSVAAVVERTGFSQRHFIATFRDEVGLTPKVFARITRFRRVIDSLRDSSNVDWSALALECGYFDQAHFIHDFRDFAGISPSVYLQRQMSSNHVRMAE